MQDSNPYITPSTLDPNQVVMPDDSGRLLGIARAQRGLMMSILGYLVSLLSLFALGNMETGLILIPGVLLMVSSLGGLVFLIMLTYRLSGTLVAVIIGLCYLIPLVGLLLMFVMNGKASRLLKQAGFKIGLLGADISQVRNAVESAGKSLSA